MAALPKGWIANMRPGEALTSYSGDQTAGWLTGADGVKSAQPKSANNPEGNVGSIPVMSITGAVVPFLECAQPR